VPAQESILKTTRILKENGNADVWVRVFPGADHTLRIPPATSEGWPHNAPGFLETLARFAKNLKLSSRS